MTPGASMRLTIFSGREQRCQIRGSASYTFLINRAQSFHRFHYTKRPEPPGRPGPESHRNIQRSVLLHPDVLEDDYRSGQCLAADREPDHIAARLHERATSTAAAEEGGQTTAKIAAVQVLFDHVPDDGAPVEHPGNGKAVLSFVALVPDALEFVEVVLYQAIQAGGLGISGPIGPAAHGPSLGAGDDITPLAAHSCGNRPGLPVAPVFLGRDIDELYLS
jgi:hypothetical protein